MRHGRRRLCLARGTRQDALAPARMLADISAYWKCLCFSEAADAAARRGPSRLPCVRGPVPAFLCGAAGAWGSGGGGAALLQTQPRGHGGVRHGRAIPAAAPKIFPGSWTAQPLFPRSSCAAHGEHACVACVLALGLVLPRPRRGRGCTPGAASCRCVSWPRSSRGAACVGQQPALAGEHRARGARMAPPAPASQPATRWPWRAGQWAGGSGSAAGLRAGHLPHATTAGASSSPAPAAPHCAGAGTRGPSSPMACGGTVQPHRA